MKLKTVVLLSLLSIAVFGQFKNPIVPPESIKDGIVSNDGSSLFGFLSSENFKMNHSIGVSYSAFGSDGLALSTYTNSMFFKLADNLNFQMDASIVQTPYSTLGKDFENNLNGIYLSKAELNYQPWKNFQVSLSYRNMPGGYYNPNGYFNRSSYNPFYYDPFFH
jgi:hypothetical protein